MFKCLNLFKVHRKHNICGNSRNKNISFFVTTKKKLYEFII